jgi:hypothetical protein
MFTYGDGRFFNNLRVEGSTSIRRFSVMQKQDDRAPKKVMGPTGDEVTLETLPAPGAGVRWVPRRKAELVAAVNGGLLTLEEACERYVLTEEEFRSWEGYLSRHGMKGLSTTKLARYREKQG